MEARHRESAGHCLSLDPDKQGSELARQQGQAQVWNAFTSGVFEKEFAEWLKKETDE